MLAIRKRPLSINHLNFKFNSPESREFYINNIIKHTELYCKEQKPFIENNIFTNDVYRHLIYAYSTRLKAHIMYYLDKGFMFSIPNNTYIIRMYNHDNLPARGNRSLYINDHKVFKVFNINFKRKTVDKVLRNNCLSILSKVNNLKFLNEKAKYLIYDYCRFLIKNNHDRYIRIKEYDDHNLYELILPNINKIIVGDLKYKNEIIKK